MQKFCYNLLLYFSACVIPNLIPMKFIIKYFAEITIKSIPVRRQFVGQLAKNLRNILKEFDPTIEVSITWDNIEVNTTTKDIATQAKIIEKLSCTPGVGSFLQVVEYPLVDLDDILEKCKQHFGEQLKGKTFCVRCKRAGKHSFTSVEAERTIGSGLMQACGPKGVSLKDPEVEVRFDIRNNALYIVQHIYKGLGGYPLASLDQVLVLMSGGYDSTVAAYQMIRRGLMPHFCFFNLGGRAHELGVMEVAHFLWRKYANSQRVMFISVPFEEVVGEILTKVDNSQMGVILKRMMLRAATKIAERFHLTALVTGEAISQVSSQTLTNLTVINQATDMLVLRPLVASHKEDIIATAEQIGTAEYARHMPEYCGVISVNPTTRAKPRRIEHEEEKFDFSLLDAAIENAKWVTIDKVMEELDKDIMVEQVTEVLPGQIVIDIRHPDQVEDHPLVLEGIEIKGIPFYAINQQFKKLDENRQYLLYCDKGMMSRLHTHHLLSEGHVNVRVYRP